MTGSESSLTRSQRPPEEGYGSLGQAAPALCWQRSSKKSTGKVYGFLSRHPHLGTLIELLYSEPDYQAFTLPPINVVLRVEQRSPELSLAVAERLGRLPLHERTREHIREALCGCGIPNPDEMLEFDFKQSDAVLLLKMLHSLQRNMAARSAERESVSVSARLPGSRDV